ncbi:GNAT family N-acetyltransferase [Streptomyces sp. WAC 06738]|uniref:GNAT family N-acetyltransferase n=1 Tax=Streptomyces sp. WAC 06738 TaxID=2203210 RepID=UPI0023E8427F|nr:GNAT family N-acetyltransferase [Streptomyces sp. WAC 06738]
MPTFPPAAVIRPAAPQDMTAIAEIYAYYVTDTVITFEETPPPPAYWQQRLRDLSDRGLPFLVAEAAGSLAGYAYAAPWRPKPAYRHTVENTIYLAPDRTGQGIGGALLAELVDRCAKADVRQIMAVIADTGDGTSPALHRRHGFTQVGRLTEVGFKHGRWVDTILMQRTLPGSGLTRLGAAAAP